MKPSSLLLALGFVLASIPLTFAGTWSDDFSGNFLGSEWRGNRNDFSISNGSLSGQSAWPVAPSPLNIVEVGTDWSDYTIDCLVNVVEPNQRVCTKGALILRHTGTNGYVFALHTATQTIEVYRLSDHEMLLLKQAPLQMKRWYRLRAVLQGSNMSFFVDDELIGMVTDNRSLAGAAGVAVQDAEQALFDDFTVTGPNISGNGLEVALTAQGLNLTWPGSLTNYVLKASDSLASPINWNVLTNSPTSEGDTLRVSLALPPANRFYSLSPKNGM
jgi:hypothetical protein